MGPCLSEEATHGKWDIRQREFTECREMREAHSHQPLMQPNMQYSSHLFTT